MTASQRDQFVVTFRAERCHSADDASRALRSLLKASLRLWGLRCIAAERVQATSEPSLNENALDGFIERSSGSSTTGEDSQ